MRVPVEYLSRIRRDFLRTVQGGYVRTVHQHSGVYRHMHFRFPEAYTWFEITTVPDRLIYGGDMGDFTFRRLTDMFEFFRQKPSGDFLQNFYVKPEYWAEKVTAVDRTDGLFAYKASWFAEDVKDALDDINYDWTPSQRAHLQHMAEYPEESQIRALDVLHQEFDDLEDFYDWGERYSYRFLWCLHAIVWAIHVCDELS